MRVIAFVLWIGVLFCGCVVGAESIEQVDEVAEAAASAVCWPGACDDENPCTDDACDPQARGYVCVHAPLPEGTSCGDDVICVDGACVEAECAFSVDGAACLGGTCLHGTCCTGCVADGMCASGHHWSACGEYGVACQVCGPGTVCVDPVIPPGPAHCE